MSDTFRAILVSRDEDKKQSVDVVELSPSDLMEGDVTISVDATTGQLQGRSGDYRQKPGGAALADGTGHRSGRNRHGKPERGIFRR